MPANESRVTLVYEFWRDYSRIYPSVSQGRLGLTGDLAQELIPWKTFGTQRTWDLQGVLQPEFYSISALALLSWTSWCLTAWTSFSSSNISASLWPMYAVSQARHIFATYLTCSRNVYLLAPITHVHASGMFMTFLTTLLLLKAYHRIQSITFDLGLLGFVVCLSVYMRTSPYW